jgi:prepilin signal peptidase PulO-like enzyme (type II secretory pathway)
MLDALTVMPLWYTTLIAFGFGVIIGSFLNVVIYRFHTGKSLGGSSHCMSCQTDLTWYELFPLVSYLTLRGRCRTCSARIPSRYFWVELATGLLFVLVALLLSPWYWLFGVMIVSVLVVVAVYDFYHMVIPNFFVWLLIFVSVLVTVLDYWLLPDVMRVVWQLLAGMLSYGFFAALWYVSKGRWIGYGDAKLALPLGYLVGLQGAFSMIVLSFWIGTVISLALILVGKLRQKRGQSSLRFLAAPLTIKSEVPFAPFLIIAFLLVYLCGVDVLSLISYALPV